MVQDLLSKKLMLLQAFNGLPERCEAVDMFRVAYLYRKQFDYLAESESEEDSDGLVSAVSRALSLSLDFGLEKTKLYVSSGKGIDTVSWNFLDSSLSDNFKSKMCKAVPDASDYIIDVFFASLEWARIDYKHRGKLKLAVAESLLNYARTATLGAIKFEDNFTYDYEAAWVENVYSHFGTINNRTGERDQKC